jgi:hypothetical protein
MWTPPEPSLERKWFSKIGLYAIPVTSVRFFIRSSGRLVDLDRASYRLISPESLSMEHISTEGSQSGHFFFLPCAEKDILIEGMT